MNQKPEMRAYTIVLLVLALFQAEASERVFRYAESVRGVTIPFYQAGEPRPYAALRVQRISKDYERRGFFRIGLLPVLVADKVTLRFLDAERSADTFARVGWLTESAVDTVEWRRVELTFEKETNPRLQAARMRPARDGGWRVWEAIVRTGTNEWRFSGGHLSVERGKSIFFHPNGGQKPIDMSKTHRAL